MKIENITLKDATGIFAEQVVITNEDGSQTIIPKSVYEAQQAAQATLVTESAPTA